jgi:hypothetical protein
MQGPELMLRSLGLGEVIDMAKRFATDQTMQKIVKFADDVDGLKETLQRIEMKLDLIIDDRQLGQRAIEPSSDAGHGLPRVLTFGHEQVALEDYRSDR